MTEPHIHGPTGGSNHQPLPGFHRPKQKRAQKKPGRPALLPKKPLFFLDPLRLPGGKFRKLGGGLYRRISGARSAIFLGGAHVVFRCSFELLIQLRDTRLQFLRFLCLLAKELKQDVVLFGQCRDLLLEFGGRRGNLGAPEKYGVS